MTQAATRQASILTAHSCAQSRTEDAAAVENAPSGAAVLPRRRDEAHCPAVARVRAVVHVLGQVAARYRGRTLLALQCPCLCCPGLTFARADERYKATHQPQEEVVRNMNSAEIHSPGFSIKGKALPGRPLYLDFQATTPVDPRVVDAMVRGTIVRCMCASRAEADSLLRQMPYFTSNFGNPHSRTHQYGWDSESAVELAREVC